WTAQRNFEAVLDLMASGALDVKPLISHRFDLEAAPEAYDLLTSGAPSMGILINYRRDPAAAVPPRVLERVVRTGPVVRTSSLRTAVIGAGNYASRTLIPALRDAGAVLHTVVSAGGVSAVHHGMRHAFERASTDADASIRDPSIDVVVVATRHD